MKRMGSVLLCRRRGGLVYVHCNQSSTGRSVVTSSGARSLKFIKKKWTTFLRRLASCFLSLIRSQFAFAPCRHRKDGKRRKTSPIAPKGCGVHAKYSTCKGQGLVVIPIVATVTTAIFLCLHLCGNIACQVKKTPTEPSQSSGDNTTM